MIQGTRITLRPFTRDMWRTYYHWRLDPEVMFWATGESYASSLVPEEAFMAAFEQSILVDHHLVSGCLGIFTDDDDFIGEISYRDMDVVAGSAVLGILIGNKSYWGKGYGTDAVRTMCRFLFQRFGLRRIQLDTWPGNVRALKAYAKVGFQVEGRLREALRVNGQPMDQMILGLLRHELLEDEAMS